VEERHYTWQTQRLLDQSYAALQEYLNERWLDSTTLAHIAPVLEARSRIDHNEREIAALMAERDELYKRQEHLRKNMAALGTAGDEGTLRARAVGQLRAGEDRLDAIDGRIAALKDENSRLQEEIGARLSALRAGEVPDTGGTPAAVPAE
jgi:chromosome segregation ATPase